MPATNPEQELAYEFVRHTHRHVFLTGKAGTGKTTFLKRIIRECQKRMVVVAPTGVAAINAGGQTIHSLFQLPFGPFLPNRPETAARMKTLRKDKQKIIKSIDLLIIDEISMVRADILDAIDYVLRRYRNGFEPFGGVQLLMIGDLYQLPPVVRDADWELLKTTYDTPYFFGARALRETPPVVVELQRVYRQTDDRFIGLLNQVRHGEVTATTVDQLNERYRPFFEPPVDEPYITLTSHNASARRINEAELAKLPGKPTTYTATISGKFSESDYPTRAELRLRVGAQVLFLRNDPKRRYFNGKIGRVVKLEQETVRVECPGEVEPITVETVEWKKVKYRLDEGSGEIDEDEEGVFTQLPLKLAWAITIHKSQGLTFDRAIIDAEAAFAHGQVYVALSRCRTWEGVVLRSQLHPRSIRTDGRVRDYTRRALANLPDAEELRAAKDRFRWQVIAAQFDGGPVWRSARKLEELVLGNADQLDAQTAPAVPVWTERFRTDCLVVGDKFRPRLERTFARRDDVLTGAAEWTDLLERALVYFTKHLSELAKEAERWNLKVPNEDLAQQFHDARAELSRLLDVQLAGLKTLKTSLEPTDLFRARSRADLKWTKRQEQYDAGVFVRQMHDSVQKKRTPKRRRSTFVPSFLDDLSTDF